MSGDDFPVPRGKKIVLPPLLSAHMCWDAQYHLYLGLRNVSAL